MSEKEFNNAVIFLDTETVPANDSFEFEFTKPFPLKADVPENGRLKDPIKIEEWKAEKLASMIADWEKEKQKAREDAEKAWRTEALESYRGRVIVLCYAKGDGDVIGLDSRNGEKEMLVQFYEDIRRYKTVNFVGHNLLFDLTFLFHRSLFHKLYGLANIIRLDSGFTKGRDFCTMESAFGGLVWKGKISLHNLCKLLGVPTSKDDIKGNEVLDAYLRGEMDRIVRYCSKDVRATRECYKILK